MKNTFPGYIRKTEKDIEKLWEHGLICFDANVLLNLYRYSNQTQNALLDLIRKFKSKVHLPHQAALEYNRNRYEVIADQEKAYKDFITKISQIQEDLKSTSKPPFLSRSVHNSLNKVFEKVSGEVEESINRYCSFLKVDPIYDQITEIFKSRISKAFAEEEIEEIQKEGEERYSKKIPPGFEDEKNKDENRKYGDLILWKQVIGLATEHKKPIILITDERKIDWWWKIKDGRNMGPRQELVEEIFTVANVDFHMYSSERFLSYGQKYHKEKINEKALLEIREMKRSETKEMERIRILRALKRKREEINSRSKEELLYLESRIKEINNDIKSHRNHMHHLSLESRDSPEINEYLHNQSKIMSKMMSEREALRSRMESIQEDNLKTSDFSSRKYFGGEENS